MRTIGQLLAIVDAVPAAALVIDTGAVLHATAEACRLLGVERCGIVGRRVCEIFSGGQLQPGPSPDPAPPGEMMPAEIFGADGDVIPVDVEVQTLLVERRILTVAVLVDGRGRRRAAELHDAIAALEQSNHDLRSFASVASHDLQAPLRTISGFASLLESTCGDLLEPPADDWLRRIISAASHLQSLTAALLALASADGASDAEFAPVDLAEVVDRAVELQDATIGELGAEVRRGELPVVVGDRHLLLQLLQNLISNALKYRGSRPPSIDIGAVRGDGVWTVSVSDNGAGIEPADQERIFEAFNRADSSGTPGTGIGLAIARSVVRRHGGEISVQSEPGVGSTFAVTLPVDQGRSAAAP